MLERLMHPPDPYASRQEKHDAAVFGMWIFIGTEVMLFGALFLGLTAYRVLYPAAFEAASHQMALALGGVNTFVLLTSSLTMALAVRAAKGDRPRPTTAMLLLTAGLGVVFLIIKAIEYMDHIAHGLWPGAGFHFAGADPQQARLFFWFYFIMTGLHALHLVIGIGVVSVLALLARRQAFVPGRYTPVEIGGLYWHLVDIVWIFLFPMLYLIGHR